MSYLASFSQRSAVCAVRIPVRIHVETRLEAILTCIGLATQAGVSDVTLEGKEAPYSTSKTKSNWRAQQ